MDVLNAVKWIWAATLALWLCGCSDQKVSQQNTIQRSDGPSSSGSDKKPIPVQLLKSVDGTWGLLRDGKPYRVLGAGGDGSLALLAECGGNSTRIWGVDGATERRLDEAHSHNMTVTVGIWLEQSQKGFDYSDPVATATQKEKVQAAVRQFKSHPAVLIWGLGNEMEGYEGGENPNVWKHIEDLAKAVKEIDPHHPTMSVVAEITPAKVNAIHEFCPSLDIIGINSYGGCTTLPQRYREAGGTKPYMVTEFGPVGTWEVPKNDIGAIEEPDSASKAKMYRACYEALSSDAQMCLGTYAFLWGNKQEGTATWFGMLLPGGQKTNSVDVMYEFWRAAPPKNRCPEIIELKLDGDNEVAAGQTVTVSMTARDSDNDTLKTRWTLSSEADSYVTGGDYQPSPPFYSNAIRKSAASGCQVRLPDDPGLYRLYVEVSDGKGSAATANLPIRVTELAIAAGLPVDLPFVIYAESDSRSGYTASGWMGNNSAISMTMDSTEQPHSGTACLKCQYGAAAGWAGVAWQDPEGDWGQKPGGKNFTGAKRLRFWARGASGGEKIKFGFGLLGRDKPHYDSLQKELPLTLSDQWQKYSIDLTGSNLQRIKTPFLWVVEASGNPVVFYLDDIVVE
jgi:hypothetical protein